jgi:hypothetical protein
MREEAKPGETLAEWGDGALASATGAPRYNRRLGDKVLAAFNHAYATGAIELAAQLREILARIEADRGEDHGERRYSSTTLGQADLWMSFVEARNDFQAACSAGDAGLPAADAALAAMKSAYDSWLAG